MAEKTITSAQINSIVGTVEDDVINTELFVGPETEVDKINGNAGDDVITTGAASDLAAGDIVGNEWTFVDGKWVYDPSQISNEGSGDAPSYDDIIKTGDGNDVLLGNGGNDQLYSGAGDDTANAGDGNDRVFGGDGDDLLNLEDGNDVAEGGRGDDVINAGTGDDIVYGDNANENVLAPSDGSNPTSFTQYSETGNWTVTEDNNQTSMSQSVATNAGETYTISFDLAANLASGATNGMVEVMWNGEVVGTVETTSGVYETHNIEVPGLGSDGELTFREIAPPDEKGPEINTDGPVFSYDTQVTIGGEEVTVSAFAPGQSNLYQVIDGQLKVFDTEQNEYVDAGDPTGLKLNAIGFNVEDDLIYGIAKSDGVDALGNSVSKKDLVMLDADGNAYRIGEAPYGDYVGDFDDQGNLWTFNSSINRVTQIDVNNLDADGNPVATNFDLPNDLFGGRAYDIAYNAAEGIFYAVEAPKTNGGEGTVHRIDISDVADGGAPLISSLPISGTLFGDEMENGMSKGAYGAVFMDGDGNLYFGLNKGDHDLDGETDASGGIYRVNMDWTEGTAHAEYMADAQSTGSNDGAVDPRSSDAFGETDTEAPFLIRNPEVISNAGGNDDLRGGEGNDTMYGGGGNDILHGGDGNDVLSGDAGADRVYGGTGDDKISGGSGDDKLSGGTGNDKIDGGDGEDYLNGELGNDILSGGAGDDKIVGGSGEDVINGGAGNDNLWGGNWWKDGAADTFVISTSGGKDMIHDFEAGIDQIDLSAYGLEFADLLALMSDKGWATEIDLSGLDGAKAGDKLIIKSVDPDDLDESSFIL